MASDKSWEAVGVVLGETASAITVWLQVLADEDEDINMFH